MKSAKPSTKTSKKPRGEVSTTTPAFVDQPAAKEIAVDPVADPIVTPPLLCAKMETFMTT